MHVTTIIGEIENRVSYQLTRAVIGHVASALYLEKPYSQRGKRRFRYAEVSLQPGSSKGNNRRMFGKEQDIPQAVLGPKSCQPSLQGERFGVGYESKVDQAASLHCHDSKRTNEGIIARSVATKQSRSLLVGQQ